MVLQVLRENQLYVKLRKCTFYQMKIHYLGHIILEEGMEVYLENIEATKSCPMPKNVKKVIFFMGLVGYYMRFGEFFSKVAHLITSL
jgi:hypothetical protein